MTKVHIDLQVASDEKDLPQPPHFEQWVSAVLTAIETEKPQATAEVSIRLVDKEESQTLNRDYRQKDKPTNVLSFPADIPDCIELPLLGDLVICAPVVAQEACEQNKALADHWAHMVIHGTLHLLGFDHIEDDEADAMETLEIAILQELGIASPYWKRYSLTNKPLKAPSSIH